MNWSYLAGFFDGEGCVQKNKNQTGRYYPYLDITNTNTKVLEEIRAFLELNKIRCKVNKQWRNNNPSHWTTSHHLTIYDKESVLTCIFGMHPYLIVKLLEVEWAWEILESVVSRKSLRNKERWE